MIDLLIGARFLEGGDCSRRKGSDARSDSPGFQEEMTAALDGAPPDEQTRALPRVARSEETDPLSDKVDTGAVEPARSDADIGTQSSTKPSEASPFPERRWTGSESMPLMGSKPAESERREMAGGWLDLPKDISGAMNEGPQRLEEVQVARRAPAVKESVEQQVLDKESTTNKTSSADLGSVKEATIFQPPASRRADAPRLEAADAARFEAADVPRFKAADATRFKAANVPRFEAADAARFEAANVPRFDGADVPRLETADVPWFEAAASLLESSDSPSQKVPTNLSLADLHPGERAGSDAALSAAVSLPADAPDVGATNPATHPPSSQADAKGMSLSEAPPHYSEDVTSSSLESAPSESKFATRKTGINISSGDTDAPKSQNGAASVATSELHRAKAVAGADHPRTLAHSATPIVQRGETAPSLDARIVYLDVPPDDASSSRSPMERGNLGVAESRTPDVSHGNTGLGPRHAPSPGPLSSVQQTSLREALPEDTAPDVAKVEESKKSFARDPGTASETRRSGVDTRELLPQLSIPRDEKSFSKPSGREIASTEQEAPRLGNTTAPKNGNGTSPSQGPDSPMKTISQVLRSPASREVQKATVLSPVPNQKTEVQDGTVTRSSVPEEAHRGSTSFTKHPVDQQGLPKEADWSAAARQTASDQPGAANDKNTEGRYRVSKGEPLPSETASDQPQNRRGDEAPKTTSTERLKTPNGGSSHRTAGPIESRYSSRDGELTSPPSATASRSLSKLREGEVQKASLNDRPQVGNGGLTARTLGATVLGDPFSFDDRPQVSVTDATAVKLEGKIGPAKPSVPIASATEAPELPTVSSRVQQVVLRVADGEGGHESVRVHMRMVGSQLQARLFAESGEAEVRLRESLPELRWKLARQGLDASSLDVVQQTDPDGGDSREHPAYRWRPAPNHRKKADGAQPSFRTLAESLLPEGPPELTDS